MYTPSFNRIDDEEQIRRFVAAARSAEFVTVDPDGVPVATLLPIMWDRGVVLAHMARANPQWKAIAAGRAGNRDLAGRAGNRHLAGRAGNRDLAGRAGNRHLAGSPALLICSGPEAYISPSWYAAKAEHGRVVPTWNYSAVHLSGTVRVHEDREWLRDVVMRLTGVHEDGRSEPWQPSDAPERYIDGQLAGIVGLEITISRVEGKAKLSQNRSKADRRGVVAGLLAEKHYEAAEVAVAMEPDL
jgi:transcriptional regulator